MMKYLCIIFALTSFLLLAAEVKSTPQNSLVNIENDKNEASLFNVRHDVKGFKFFIDDAVKILKNTFLEEDNEANTKTIKLHNINTEEKIEIIFWRNDGYVDEAISEISNLLIDHRSNQVIRVDPELISLAYDIKTKLKYDGYIKVISGYRSKETNDKMREQGRKVAKNSMHSLGKAIDIELTDIKSDIVRDTAIELAVGGVGYYPKSGFVHIDTGDLRQW